MALIKLTGKYAVGDRTFAIVDDDMVEFLSQWRWKAKPNGGGNNVYAVRNAYIDGKCVTVRMHRVVAGMRRDDPLEIDHDNHNSLDNRRINLIPATRRANALNARRVTQTGKCGQCGESVTRTISACASGNRMTCHSCQTNRKKIAAPKQSAVFFSKCKHCSAPMSARRSGKEFCGDTCRCRFRAASGYVQPSRRRDAQPCQTERMPMLPARLLAGPPPGISTVRA